VRVLITGGCGFIGSHLVDAALKEGHEVVVIDNFSTGRLQNLDHEKGNPKLRIEEADISDISQIAPIFKNVGQVYHLAALADIVPSMEHPIEYHNANVVGTINVLEACRQSGVKRLIYAASSSCYGIPDSFPTPESSEIRPEYPYALTTLPALSYIGIGFIPREPKYSSVAFLVPW